jgi:peptide/nickel transport system substrate-binding protein
MRERADLRSDRKLRRAKSGAARRTRLSAIGLSATALVLALAAAGCGGDGGGGADDTGIGTLATDGEPARGGIYRIQTTQFNHTGGFDPTGEYLGTDLAFYSNLLVRTLIGYEHSAGEAGNELVPDLATDLGQVSDDKKTYTFTLKDGVKFGPPLNRDITSEDILFAFKRIGTTSLVAQYGFYYTPIDGMAEFTEAGGLGKAGNEISGIETPDPKTIVFHLTEPTGDFLYRLAMPAAGPIPEEVAGCFKRAGEYGRYVVSSGPYMLEGSAELDATSCKTLKPVSGNDPNRRMRFVRNPAYDPSTDGTRPSYVDGFDYSINTNPQDIYNKIEAGELEGEVEAPPPQVLRKYSTDSSLKDRLQVGAGDRTWYITMNLTQPPFDDIHVRKAMNLVMDKSALQRAWGGPLRGEIAHHIVPDSMFNGDLDEYAPYKTEGDSGDVAKAKEEMKQSKYDTDQDGMCDAPECNGILYVNRNVPPFTDMEPTIVQNAASIGIELNPREFEDAYPIIQDATRNVPVSSVPGWGKDYADASTFMVLFDSASILPQGNVNYSLTGLTPEAAREGDIGGSVQNLPSVDEQIDECNVLVDAERVTCWQELDKHLMENVVPWVPYLDATNVDILGPAVTAYEYDQFSGEAAFSRLALDPSKQEGSTAG